MRWSAAVSAGLPAAHRTAELAHLVMSAAMVVMTWSWFGTAGLWVQITLFTVFAVFFAGTAVRGVPCGSAGRVAGAAHALMAAAMVWMLAAMPVIMPVAVAAGGSGGHAGHGGGTSEGTGHAAHAGQAGWAVTVTVLLCVALLVTAGFWAVRAIGHGGRAGDPLTPDDPAEVADGPAGGPTGDPAGGGRATLAVTTHPAAPPSPPGRLGARADAACHAVAGLGMVLMLAAMVAGW
nr:DUF5134 domain-containing protein [Pseudonocardia sp. C8]